jgi:myo-inositol-1-phosphate synthase
MEREKIKIAIVGTGNGAAALYGGLQYYGEPLGGAALDGLITGSLGGYEPRDIEIVAAFDVVKGKVGRSLPVALSMHPNCYFKFEMNLARGTHAVHVQRGPTLDGLGEYLRSVVEEDPSPPVDVAAALRESGAEILVNYLPVGSEEATRYYARCALEAGCAFVNCMPAFIANDHSWAARFADAKIPLIGDDIKSQLGATIVHRALASLFKDRGVLLDHTYQLNVGGTADFFNMLERERLVSKKISKTQAVTSVAGREMAGCDVHIGPSDHVPWLGERKVAFIRLEGHAFCGAPVTAEVRLEVTDPANSAAVVMDAVRCAMLALDRGEGGAIRPACAWYMKSPPDAQIQDDDPAAEAALRAWIAGGVQ